MLWLINQKYLSDLIHQIRKVNGKVKEPSGVQFEKWRRCKCLFVYKCVCLSDNNYRNFMKKMQFDSKKPTNKPWYLEVLRFLQRCTSV